MIKARAMIKKREFVDHLLFRFGKKSIKEKKDILIKILSNPTLDSLSRYHLMQMSQIIRDSVDFYI